MPNYRRRRWREAMAVRVDLNGCAAVVGRADVTAAALQALRPRLAECRAQVRAWLDAGKLGGTASRDEVRRILAVASEVPDAVDTVAVLGIGSSGDAGAALAASLPAGDRRRRVRLCDTIDPESVRTLIGDLDLAKTVFTVVSRSGDTAETLALFLIIRDRLLRDRGAVDYKRHLIVATTAEGGSLRQIVHDEGFPSVTVPDAVAPHFAGLTSVGLLPAALAGVDVSEVLAGAASVTEGLDADADDVVSALAGGLWLPVVHADVHTIVVMPFADRLLEVARLSAGAWAAALGAGAAERPLPAIAVARGTVDQYGIAGSHMGPPRRAMVAFLRVEDHGDPIDVPSGYHDLEDVRSLGGQALGALFNGAQRAAEVMCAERGCPTLAMTIPTVNAFTMGQVVHLWNLATATVAALAGVDPFAPVFVDEAKRLLFGVAGRPGYEPYRDRIDAWVRATESQWIR